MKMFTTVIIIFFAFVSLSDGDIYSWIDDNGVKHYSTDQPQREESVTRQQEYRYSQGDYAQREAQRKKQQDQMLENNGPGEQTPQGDGVSGKTAVRKHGKVVIYTRPGCTYCVKARDFFKRHKISYTEYDISTDPQAKERFKKLKGQGVPLIFVGETRIPGYSDVMLKRALGIAP